MKVRNTNHRAKGKTALMMTPMIDIVFQLLVFFIMTFKIVSPEGDFNIKMPKGYVDGPVSEMIPIQIALRADDDGELTHAVMDDLKIGGRESDQTENAEAIFAEMRRRVRALVPDAGGPGAEPCQQEVQFDCDRNLKYRYVIDAITAVSGYVDDDNHVMKIIEKIKFSRRPEEPLG